MAATKVALAVVGKPSRTSWPPAIQEVKLNASNVQYERDLG